MRIPASAASHSETAASYDAVNANASTARLRRKSNEVPPSRSISFVRSAYWFGLVTTATDSWFFAAARTIAGPPMSISSISASLSSERFAEVNG